MFPSEVLFSPIQGLELLSVRVSTPHFLMEWNRKLITLSIIRPFILGKLLVSQVVSKRAQTNVDFHLDRYSNCFMVLLNQRYHGSDSRSGTTASHSYQHGSRPDAQGYSIELRPQAGAKTSKTSSTSYHSPRTVQPPLPKAQGSDDDF